MPVSNEDSISLNKYISETGICSRREADKMIEAGRVTINGQATKKGNRVSEGDIVSIDGAEINTRIKRIYLAFHKPTGIVCTTDSKEKKNIISYINHPQRLFPIGRLDKPSEGLIFLTNDGDIVNKILRAGNNHDKEYIVTVNRPISTSFINKMKNGIPILGTVTKKCKITQLSENTFRIILTQGLNKQIRRMCEFLEYKVIRLKRTRIMNIRLDNLEKGKWRYFTQREIDDINLLISHSSNTEEASVDHNKKFKNSK